MIDFLTLYSGNIFSGLVSFWMFLNIGLFPAVYAPLEKAPIIMTENPNVSTMEHLGDESQVEGGGNTLATEGSSTRIDSNTMVANVATSAFPAATEPVLTFDPKTLLHAVVNIVCTSKVKGINSMTGSGVMLDSKGVIITNAHVGQYFLFTEYRKQGLIRCVIRTGNPAVTAYTAELIHISSDWIEENKTQLTGTKTKGTGEDDFALLYITGNANGSLLPITFSALPYESISIRKNDPVVVAGYPAEFIPTSEIGKNLYSLYATTKIDKVYTFGRTTTDLVSMRGSVVAQKGSSGGAVTNTKGVLGAVIVTATSAFVENERNLFAITISYIDRALKLETGKSLRSFLDQDLTKQVSTFKTKDAPYLEKILTEQFTVSE